MTIPHLRFPVSFSNGKAATVTQDSHADHTQRARLVLAYPEGACVDLPPFGTPDTTFSQGGVNLDVLTDAVQRWEPSIAVDVIREAAIQNDGSDAVTLNVRSGT